MQTNEPLPAKQGLSLKRRVGIILSVLWLIAIFVVSLNVNVQDSYYGRRSSINEIGFFTGFVVFGVMPVILCFGIAWVAAARRRKP